MNKKTLSLNLLFWTDFYPNSSRERNVRYALRELKNLTNFLSEYVDISLNIFDYSTRKFLEDGEHIPYPPAVYKRSEKINNILTQTFTNYFSIIDSDVFVCRQDYQKLGEIVSKASVESCITFDVIDLDEEKTEKIIYENADPLSFSSPSRFPGVTGGLGAFFITSTENLRKHDGFNEKFTSWGGEDGEIYARIYKDNSIEKIRCTKDNIRLFHLSHFRDTSNNKNYYDRAEYEKNNGI